MKMHILQSFVSQDHNRVLQAELQRMSQNTRETVLTFVQRFVQLVKWLCVGLKDGDLVRRLMRRGELRH